MDISQRNRLKRYIKKLILESDVIDIKTAGDTSITAELNKPIYAGLPISQAELSTLKGAIKSVDSAVNSIDYDNRLQQISFERNISENNFYYVIRKIVNMPQKNEYKYVMWFCAFKQREDIDKPGNVQKKESPKFDVNFSETQISDIINNFIKSALLMNI